MRKRIWKLAAILCVCSMVSGCNGKITSNISEKTEQQISKQQDTVRNNADVKLPSKKKVFFTDLENCDITYIVSAMYNSNFDFRIISSEKLEENKIRIEFNTDAPYSYGVGLIEEQNSEENNGKSFDYALFLAYNGYNWKDIKENDNESDLYEAYDNLGQKDLLELYEYRVDVKLDLLAKKMDYKPITKMKVTYGNQNYNFNIGKICFDYDTKYNRDYSEYVYCGSTFYYDYDIGYSSENKFTIDTFEIENEKKIKINDISILGCESCQIESVEIEQKDGEGNINYYWEKGDNLVLQKGKKSKFILHMKTNRMKEQLNYYIQPHIAVDYTIDGKKERIIQPVLCCSTISGKYEQYAYRFDGINIFEYYDSLNEEYEDKGILLD
ncbi:MAG: hypothetical protein ACLRZ9_01590 [Eubacterium sp.]